MTVYTHRAEYAVNVPITGGNHQFGFVLSVELNTMSFQVGSDVDLVSGDFVLYGTNQNLPVYGDADGVLYPPPIAPVEVDKITVSGANFFGVLTSPVALFALYWVEYVGAGTGKASIALCGKSNG